MKLHRAIGARAGELADLIHAETGKPEIEALSEVVVVLDHLGHLARIAPRELRPRRISPGWVLWKRAYTVPEPWGVVGVIAPWNFPLLLTAEPVITALMAGNGVVLKPSEYAPFSALRLQELARGVGLPEGLLGVVTGGAATGQALVTGGVDRVVFTGSSATGRRVMAAAAEGLVPVTLELGGKDAAIVLEDADLDRAARGVVWGAFYNAGQACLSVERVYVVEAVHDTFLAKVAARTRELRAGWGPGTDVGPMVTPFQLAIVEEQLTDALARGARIVVGGGRTDPASNTLLPTVLMNVDDRMKLMREETFGPLLPVVRVRDQEEAVARVNQGGYGLYASVWTGDRRRGEELALRIRAGGVSVNDVISHWSIPGLPVGGVGESGFGRSRGREGLRELSRLKSVMVDRGGLAREPWWYPYTPGGLRLARATASWRRYRGVKGLVAGAWRVLAGGDP
jgi:acyl-CoA reductase-like NAD-dependent aldehyde dehydrogenase